MMGRWLGVTLLFVGSGFPALIYQIVWQRSLFTLFGTDSVAVAVIVSAFMLGLGAGSLLGGEISQSPRIPLLKVFAGLELGTGLFALVSLRLFEGVGSTSPTSPFDLFWLSFLLVLVPTVMMGMTLPLLSTFLVRRSGMVGRSVGTLYAANTAGSALACFVAAYGLMPYLGKQQSLLVAAAINAVVGLSVLLLDGWERTRAHDPAPSPMMTSNGNAALPISLGMLATAISGLLSLGFEIAWYRMFSFATAGRAETFPVMLGYFLLGTAAGSLLVGWTASPGGFFHRRPRQGLALLLASASIAGLLVTPLLVLMAPHVPGTLRQAVICIVPAALFGMVLPIACELCAASRAALGRSLGLLYAANIAGATLGALAVGLALMDILPLRLVSVALMAGGLVSAAVLHGKAGERGLVLPTAVLCMALLASGAALVGPFFERLQPAFPHDARQDRFAEIIENRSGVITVDHAGIVYGGGVYDGRFHLDLLNDINGVVRPFALGAVHPAPERVLMIGLSGGVWAQIVANNPTVKSVVIVEINPGYVDLVKRHEMVASLLTNPKVTVVAGDGRQWLRAHPHERFDAIMMNATFSWRTNATNILSQEFMRLVASHLATNGVAFVNPTGSPEVVATALSVFPGAIGIRGSLYLGNGALTFDRVRWLSQLEEYRIDGRPVIDRADSSKRSRLGGIVANTPVADKATIAREVAGRKLITDDNMGMEWPRKIP